VNNKGFSPGRYRLEVTDELVRFVEQTFLAPLPPSEREAARAETSQELASSELELARDGTLVSRANGVEALRVALPGSSLARQTLTFEKAPGIEVRLECVSADEIVAVHPAKPPLRFKRA
jgi:hypothetical protein